MQPGKGNCTRRLTQLPFPTAMLTSAIACSKSKTTNYCCPTRKVLFMMSGFLLRTYGISSSVCCPLCQFSYDWELNWPTTGRCGHTICSDCHMKRNVHEARNDGRWQPCPFGNCSSDMSFEIEQSPNTQSVAGPCWQANRAGTCRGYTLCLIQQIQGA
jgi:hypothetical protein